jgi:protease-4
MEKYGVSYERLIAGKYKDLGTPFKKLDQPEKELLQKKLDLLQNYFIHEISQNRKLEENKVKTLATGEFFLGGEALELGLIDELGDTATAQEYLQKTEQIKELKIIRYETEISFLKLLTKVWTDFPVKIGQGIGSILVEQENKVMLI